MKIDHIALWTNDLEKLKNFYLKYFRAVAGELYHNTRKDFRSYFLAFGDGGCRLEIMQMPGVPASLNDARRQFIGLIHFAIDVGSKAKVDELTELLRKDGYPVIGEPRTTGDGYYESVILDPDGNRVEIQFGGTHADGGKVI
jgi:lactoylglutathione lyase